MPRRQPPEFERYVRTAIAKSTRVHSVAALIRATGLHPNTIYDLFNKSVVSPGPKTMSLIADALDVPLAELWAAWEEKELPPDTAQEALRRHTEAVEEQNRLLSELVSYVRAAAFGVVNSPQPDQEVQEQMQEALQRADGLSRGSSRPTRRPRPVTER